MKHEWSISVMLFFFALGLASKAEANIQITPSVTVSPNIFPAGQASSFFTCVTNGNPDSNKNIIAGDTFPIAIANAGGTVTSAGPLLVSSPTLLSTDFAVTFGATLNDIFITYVGVTQSFRPGDTFCLQISLQASTIAGPFQITLNGPNAPARYNSVVPSLLLASVVDFPTGGVPAGAIILWDLSGTCPTGFTRVAAFDGRSLVGSDTPGINGGSITHAHGAGSYTAPSHTHGPGSYAASSHTHGPGSYTASEHTHGAGSYTAASHTHTISRGPWPSISEDQGHGIINVGNLEVQLSGDISTGSAGGGTISGTSAPGGGGTISGTSAPGGGGAISGVSAPGGAGAITGTSALADSRPPIRTILLCRKD